MSQIKEVHKLQTYWTNLNKMYNKIKASQQKESNSTFTNKLFRLHYLKRHKHLSKNLKFNKKYLNENNKTKINKIINEQKDYLQRVNL